MHRFFQLTIALIVLTACLTGLMTETVIAAIQNSGSISQTNLILWNFKTNGVIYGTPLVDNGRVYIGSLDSCFYAIDAASGIELWRYKSQDQIFSTPIRKDTILCFESGNVLYGVNLQGQLSWKFKMYDSTIQNKHDEWDYYHSSPLLVGNIVYIGTEKGLAYGVDVRNGAKVFQCQTPSAKFTIETTPAVYDNKIYFGDWDGVFYAYDLTNGNLVWQYDTKVDGSSSYWVNAIVTDPIIYRDAVYFGGRSCNLYCLDAKTGSKKWMTPDGQNMWILGGPTLVDSTLYLGSSYQHTVRAFNAVTGSVKWKRNVEYRVNGKPVIDGDFVFIGTEHDTDDKIGTLCALNKSDGTMRSKISIGTQIYSTPTLSNGIIFFGGSNGFVYAVRHQEFLGLPYPKMQLSCPDTIDFGSFPKGSTEAAYKLYVHNLGNVTDSITISSTMGQIKIQPPVFNIAANDSQEVTITMDLSLLSIKLYRTNINFTSQRAVMPASILKPVIVRIQPATGVESKSSNPHTFSLNQNYPNPFNPSTILSYQIPAPCKITLIVFDVRGREIMTLVDQYQDAGNYDIRFDGRELNSGVYFSRIHAVPTGNQTKTFIQTNKIVLLK